jgi:chromosome segregation ATPase
MSLTEEDKLWISQVLDEKLERLETKLDEKLDGLETKLVTHQQLDEKLEHLETKLLTAFHTWASPLEARRRTHTATLKAIDAEMEYLSNRVKKLEPQPHA